MAWDISGATSTLNTQGAGVQSALGALTSNTDPAKAPALAAQLTAQSELLKIVSAGIDNYIKTTGEATAKLASR